MTAVGHRCFTKPTAYDLSVNARRVRNEPSMLAERELGNGPVALRYLEAAVSRAVEYFDEKPRSSTPD